MKTKKIYRSWPKRSVVFLYWYIILAVNDFERQHTRVEKVFHTARISLLAFLNNNQIKLDRRLDSQNNRYGMHVFFFALERNWPTVKYSHVNSDWNNTRYKLKLLRINSCVTFISTIILRLHKWFHLRWSGKISFVSLALVHCQSIHTGIRWANSNPPLWPTKILKWPMKSKV